MRRKIYNYKPIISRTTRSAILTAPTKTSMLNTNSPIQLHTIDTAAASGSTAGGEAAKRERMIQPSTIIAPSRQTAAQDSRSIAASNMFTDLQGSLASRRKEYRLSLPDASPLKVLLPKPRQTAYFLSYEPTPFLRFHYMWKWKAAQMCNLSF